MFRFGEVCAKALFWTAVVVSMVLVTVVLSVKYAVMPNIERYQGDIISRVAAISGMDVSAKAIRGGWSGFRPYVELEEVILREPADSTRREAGDEALRLPQFRASLSWWSLFVGQFRFAEVALAGPELALSRGKDGLIYFAGRALNAPTEIPDDGRLLEALLEQPGVSIHHATLTWDDELAPGKSLKFTDVGLSLDKRASGHAFGFVATPPRGLARNLQLTGKLKIGRDGGRWQAIGAIFALLDDANLAEIREHLALPDALQSGFGNVRAWVDIDSTVNLASIPSTPANTEPDNAVMVRFNPVRNITADVNLVNARAQLASDLAPLHIAKLAGRIEYVAEEGGFTIRSRALEFRTRSGVTSAPADFSVTLQNQSDVASAKGEITANDIDLKALAALLEYFPIGKEMRALAARFSPRGLVQQSAFSWTGHLDNPLTYRIKGRLTNFGSQSDERIPGVSGFSGTLEGDEKGGKFSIASNNMRFEAPAIFRLPVNFSTLDSAGDWKVTAEAIEVNLARAKFTNEDMSGDIKGRYWRYRADGPRAGEEKGPGSLDLNGKFENIKATRVPNYLPNAAVKSREYIEWAIRAGEVSSVDIVFKGAIYDFPFRAGKGGLFRIDAKFKDIDYRYGEGWPVANDINGGLTFENTHFEANVDAAKILGAPVKDTTIVVDDFSGTPPILTIKGVAEARAEDASRYLKESPLIDNVGVFTRFVTLDGPGKLELELKFFLGAKEQSKINGKYNVARARARLPLGERGIEITNLNGGVAFTESSVKSSGLSGIAYGNPIAIAIAGAGEVPVAVDFTARADAVQLSDVLPIRLPSHVSGQADFIGRVSAKAGATEVVIESSLIGIASTLPAPLGKRADEARKLRVAFSNTGIVGEKIRVSLAGNAGSDASATDSADTRIDARFQRRFDAKGSPQGFFGGVANAGSPLGDVALAEGMWLGGTLPRLDFDAWRIAIDSFYPPRAASTAPLTSTDNAIAKNDSPIAGFDFRLGGLLAYGRQFNAMTLKGRHGVDGWGMSVDSSEASGDFTWRPAAFNERGLVRARLQRFTLADEAASPTPVSNPPPDAGKEPDLPALDIVAEKFTFKDRLLGRLDLRATPQGVNWKIDQLDISNGHAKLEMKGLSQRYGDLQDLSGQPRTTMTMKLETSNLNALFNQFGFGDYMKGGNAKLDGQFSWPGLATNFQTNILSGNFKVHAADGRFAKIEPGAGKLLGLMSLQSLPRRITLDFRDIFSEGLAFNKIEGDVKITNGIMATDNFEIKGPAAYIKTAGDVSLPTEKVNLKMKVAPLVGEGAAIGAAVFLTPVVGAGVYAISKLLEGALSYELLVTGQWDDPHVDEVKKNAPSVPPPSPIPPSSPAPTSAATADPNKKTP